MDCDPARPADSNATDAEKAAAWDPALRVRGFLTARGWPAPAVADSGNGYHLLYRIDLPNDPAADRLVCGVLRALARRFNSPAVKIDTTVSNAARITKLYGTPTRKGVDAPERPRRPSRLLETPEVMSPVPADLLDGLAAQAPPEAVAVQTRSPSFWRSDVTSKPACALRLLHSKPLMRSGSGKRPDTGPF